MGAGSAHAASFDCARARSAVEKRICADPLLSSADSDLGAAYAEARASTPAPISLRNDQNQWLAESRNVPGADLRAVMAVRASDLRAQAAADRRARLPIALATLSSRCAPLLAPGPCRVASSGRVAGGPGLFWQILQGTDEEAAAVVLQAGPAPGQVTPLVWTRGQSVSYAEPEVVQSPAGRILDLGGSMMGTGAFNVEAVFIQSGRTAWTQVDTQGWLRDLKLPAGMGIWKGVYPEFKDFSATTAYWKSSDANCCPTGGLVEAELRLEGDRLVIASVKLTPGEDAARGE